MTTTASIAPATTEQTRNDVTQASASLAGRVLLSAIFILSGFSKLAAPAMMIGYHGQRALTREAEWFDALGRRWPWWNRSLDAVKRRANSPRRTPRSRMLRTSALPGSITSCV